MSSIIGRRFAAKGSRFYALGALGAVLSWTLLFWSVFATNPMPFAGLAHSELVRHHLVTIAQVGVATSLAFLVLGALREGFSALSRFFDAILERTSKAARSQAEDVNAEARAPVDPSPSLAAKPVRRSAQIAEEFMAKVQKANPNPQSPAQKTAAVAAASNPAACAADVLPGRRFRRLPDGTIELETVLGARRFASMEEARLFVGLGPGPRKAA